MISSADIHNAKVLIVDDQEANVRMLDRMLRRAGYACIASTMDPHEVCELHRKNHYDLILLDLVMPGMDGFQVMEGLKEIEKDGYLPVLVITAQPEHKLRALKAGAKDFVSKPLDLAEVLTRVYNMLEVRLLHQKTRRLYDQASHLAQHDFLTDLPNPVLLNDRITQAIALARRYDKQFAVLFLDLDHFKRINDSLGHATGDKLLQSVALRLKACVRGSDTVSRKGGDEFVVLISEIAHAEHASRSADKIIAAVTAAHQVAGHELLVTASIGISIYPHDGADAETLLKSADAAMYQAKKNGRNQYWFFRQEMNPARATRVRL
ncbi:MAG: diguanylate cyclase [Burkholderiales bacterium]